MISNTIGSNSTESVGILHYNDRDVLSGRGGGTNLHPGNRYYRELILSQCSAYEEASKMMKPEISRQIVREIREKGGRFLRKLKTDGMYFEIDESTARGKTSQALRHRSFEFRNILDPKRIKMNGRWNKSVKTDNEKKTFQATSSILPHAVSKGRLPSSSNPLPPPPPDFFSQSFANKLGCYSKANNNVVIQQAPHERSYNNNPLPNINNTNSVYQQRINELTSFRQRGDFLQYNRIILEEQSRHLSSSTPYFDLLRFYQRNSSSGLYSNSVAHHSDMFLNPAMTSVNNNMPNFQQERNANIRAHFPINNNVENIGNETNERPINNNVENIGNETSDRPNNLNNARMQHQSSSSFPFCWRRDGM